MSAVPHLDGVGALLRASPRERVERPPPNAHLDGRTCTAMPVWPSIIASSIRRGLRYIPLFLALAALAVGPALVNAESVDQHVERARSQRVISDDPLLDQYLVQPAPAELPNAERGVTPTPAPTVVPSPAPTETPKPPAPAPLDVPAPAPTETPKPPAPATPAAQPTPTTPAEAEPAPELDVAAVQTSLRPLPTTFAPAWPTRGEITTYFGEVGPYSPRGHTGLDVAAPRGTPIVAADEGEVVKAYWSNDGYGGLVIIAHVAGYETWYAHLSRIDATPGQHVKKGEPIGLMGSTGYSTGSHLHFEVRQEGQLRDPLHFLKEAALRSIDML